MTSISPRPTIAIIGAGLAGAYMALYLGQRGYNVQVYERRADPRNPMSASSGPSMNLGLSQRGIRGLTDVGLIDEVMQQAIPMRGRMVHAIHGTRTFQSYGKDQRQVIYAIKRNNLNKTLISAAERLPQVRFHFSQRCVRIDKQARTVQFHDEQTEQQTDITADIIIGADGVFSTVRQQMQRGERANYQQEFLDWGWKELTIPPSPSGESVLEQNVFHLWPRGSCMIFAHPNLDGRFCCSCLLPFEGQPSFASLQTEAAVSAFFAELFSDIVPLTPNLVADFMRNPIIPLISVHTSPWHYQDWIVLLGDAAHAVYPFYAQGMNAAFEDCLTLGACLERHPGQWASAFAEYQTLRKQNTDALAALSEENFLELRDRVRSPLVRVHKRVDWALSRLFPQTWAPLHAMISHTTIPYSKVLQHARRQNRALAGLGLSALASAIWLVGRTIRRRQV
jgi:kynurenine 3-monooxygenase